ncbi:4'-phosphopantetheinyl transferase family protein [Shewanella gaetbuli]
MKITASIYFIPFKANFTAQDFDAGLALGWLNEAEQLKVARYSQQNAKYNALQVRLALRALLSTHADIAPQEWQFEYGDKGKPQLSQALFEQSGLLFNLSHSGDWLAVAIVDTHLQNINNANKACLGIDIERCRRNTNIHTIMNHYFTPDEVSQLALLGEADQRQRFFDLWALKEAFIKATGKGLAQSLTSFGFSFAANKVLKVADESVLAPYVACDDYVRFHAPEALQHQPWHFLFGRLNTEYRFSLCWGLESEDSSMHSKPKQIVPDCKVATLEQLISGVL